MNAGYAEDHHWVHEDGGRIIGEGCHIIDLMTSFTNEKINVTITTKPICQPNSPIIPEAF